MKRRISDTKELDNKKNKAKEKDLEFEKRYHVLFDKMLNGFTLCKLLTDKRGNPVDYVFLEVNRAFEKINSMKKKDVINKKVTEVFGFKDIPDLEKYAQVALQGKEKVFETHIPRYNKYFEVVSYSPRKGYFVTIFEDITQRKKAEEKIQELNKKLNSLLEQRTKELIEEQNYTDYLLEYSPDCQITLDNEEKIINVNQAFEEITGKTREKLIGNFIYKFIPQEVIKKIRGKILKEKRVKNIEITVNIPRRKSLVYNFSGAIFTNIQGKPVIYLSGRDITEKRKLEQNLKELNENLEKKIIERSKKLRETQDQLIQSEKLSVIGQLAAGIAHEIRNPLTTMSLAIQYLEKKCYDDFQKDKLGLVQKNINRINEIIQGLLTFSRPYNLSFTHENVNMIIEKLEPILESLCSSDIKNIKIIKKYDLKLTKIWVDSHHLEQVFLNLALNAIKAMRHSGELYISTNYDPKQKEIKIKFKDTGCGIPKDNIKKLFDPFFTTYKKGTGLGLPICQMIINEHEGNISAESRLGEGTTFTILLPLDRRRGR
ncbi:MAG: PAS domain S-box protein [Candidatus Atribacteria bacterium]|nr:PAS domain S-box protein [Candidatus Atribacteria bacterium]